MTSVCACGAGPVTDSQGYSNMGKLFGTDGIRGEANRYPMDGITAFQLGQAVTHVLKSERRSPRIIVGRDTRISGYMLENAFVAGVAAMGGTPYAVGVLPTPGVAFITRDVDADAGAVISASHNPYQDNGIKFFSGAGFKLPDEQQEAIERLVLAGRLDEHVPPARQIGRGGHVENVIERYVEFLTHTFPRGLSIRGMKLVLDAANGAAGRVAPRVFAELGADLEVIHNAPDGFNINENCGSQHPRHLEKCVKESGASMGLAFDGDADRLIAVDEKGRTLTGDQVLIICARDMKERGQLKNNRVVSTVMSNIGLGIACRKCGLELHTSRVGDRYVLEEMQRLDAMVGGEDSGHMIFLNHHTTGDGILAALQLVATVAREGRSLSELASVMDVFPQELINVEIRTKPLISSVPAVTEAIRAVEAELGDQGRVLVRYSGTQNVCRVMVEGPTAAVTRKFCTQIAEVVKRSLG